MPWKESQSRIFTVPSGVRQGGVLSPILFTVYLDDLLNELKLLNHGLPLVTSLCWCIMLCRWHCFVSPFKWCFAIEANVVCENLLPCMDFLLTVQRLSWSTLLILFNPILFACFLLIISHWFWYTFSYLYLGHILPLTSQIVWKFKKRQKI